MSSFAIAFVWLLSNMCCAQSAGEPPEVRTGIDTIYVRSTQWPSTEKDELILCRQGKVTTLYTLFTADGSSITFLFSAGDHTSGYNCFEVYNNAGGGSSYIFYNKARQCLYITYGTYEEFDPIPASVDFEKQEVLLKNRYSAPVPADTLYIGRETGYIVSKSPVIRVEFKEINQKQHSNVD